MNCGPPPGGASLEGVDVSRQAVVQGLVTRADQPVERAYVRLLDGAGEFVAEVATEAGRFRFFAADGPWTVRVLAPGSAPTDRTVQARIGAVADVTVELDPAQPVAS